MLDIATIVGGLPEMLRDTERVCRLILSLQMIINNAGEFFIHIYLFGMAEEDVIGTYKLPRHVV